MIRFTQRGDFAATEKFLRGSKKKDYRAILEKYAAQGVQALSSATPVNTGQTAQSWGYEIEEKNGNLSIFWTNSHMAESIPVVILLQYGHGTGTGGYVQGEDFINPAIRPIFDQIAENLWKEVNSL